jgi:hypothetical protein
MTACEGPGETAGGNGTGGAPDVAAPRVLSRTEARAIRASFAQSYEKSPELVDPGRGGS